MNIVRSYRIALPGKTTVDESTLIALVALYFAGLARINEVVDLGTEDERIVSRLEGTPSDPFPMKPPPGKLPDCAREVCTYRAKEGKTTVLRVVTVNADPATQALGLGLVEGFSRRWPGALVMLDGA
jgi:hypothetical protein